MYPASMWLYLLCSRGKNVCTLVFDVRCVPCLSFAGTAACAFVVVRLRLLWQVFQTAYLSLSWSAS